MSNMVGTNVEAFTRWELRPRVLVDVGEVSTATSVLGIEVALPVLVAPTAFQRLADPEGEPAMARAAAAAGTIMCLSTIASVTPAELAAAVPGSPLWFQLYWSQDRGFTKELLAQVVEARFTALVLTVDFPVAGRRERDIRLAFTLPDDLPAPNLPVALARKDFHSALGHIVDATLTWRDLEWLRSACELPLVLKDLHARPIVRHRGGWSTEEPNSSAEPASFRHARRPPQCAAWHDRPLH